MGVKVEDIGVTRGERTPDMVSESVTFFGNLDKLQSLSWPPFPCLYLEECPGNFVLGGTFPIHALKFMSEACQPQGTVWGGSL